MLDIKLIKQMTDIDSIFTEVSSDKIRIIKLTGTEERKLVHQYLEQFHSTVKKVSLKSKHFTGERIGTFIKCYGCDYKKVPINNYHYGALENNKDEWRSGECPKCGEHISWEPNYDDWDDVKCVYGNNIIAFGSWFKDYNSPNHATSGSVNKEEIIKIMTNKKIYEMAAPASRIGKRKVIQYIDEELEKQFK
ncbi:Hypothetical protein HVR_LOCUS778 [uncultured virus]|nr:Hypothetical protein HVR_LOCUS778 [uncultured virus]